MAITFESLDSDIAGRTGKLVAGKKSDPDTRTAPGY